MLRALFISIFTLLFSMQVVGQQVDTDSLLKVAYREFNESNNLENAKKLSWKALEIAPDYLDYHVLLGRIHQRLEDLDSARYYFDYVLDRDDSYHEVYFYLIPLIIKTKDYDSASKRIDEAKVIGIDQAPLLMFEHEILVKKGNHRDEYDFLKATLEEYPEISEFRQRFNNLESRFNSDRIGINYSLTGFSREGVGPWHLTGLQYIREREWGSLIGRVNYADRLSAGESISSGFQYEVESYFFTGKTSYSYAGLAYSNDIVFPNLRFGYSFFKNFQKGWEGEVGLRYTVVSPPEGNREFRSGIIGVGKYLGSYWLNLRMFIQNEEDSFYPAFTFTSRYYLGGRFDYLSFIVGYGTSPDERTTLGQFDNRVALESYRFGFGYYKSISEKFFIGVQLMYNYQEYNPSFAQNEYEGSLNLQYRLK
ncbi:YaiO family outer membrane beta-barrel protein [Belliella sp. DSM 107340]|uniref:YaiO family outer membrane beta-barrel protein n=1 Tax=Belliella calami TaxID=2923436 RepID=A0ABS9UKJ0_9BACT|nr:YaiO family outer membrane beta-barrel protein [Belliella calami]MCH7397126.1 YaiO family outer membrane beta-barrel protein [Belliella calami]